MSFYTILLSNASESFCPNNSLSRFTNVLPHQLHLYNDEWQVAVQSVSFHNEFLGIPAKVLSEQKQFIRVWKHHDGTIGGVKTYSLPIRSFESIGEVFLKIKHLIEEDDNIDVSIRNGNILKIESLLPETIFVGIGVETCKWLNFPTTDRNFTHHDGVRYFYSTTTHKGKGGIFTTIESEREVSIPNQRPHYVRVSLSQIAPYFDVGGVSSCAIIIPPPSLPEYTREIKPGHHYEVNNRQYYSLNKKPISTFEVVLQDQNQERLVLAPGQPTIIKLKFKNMNLEKKTFMLRVSSKDSDKYSVNVSHDFRSRLAAPLHLEGKWTVALSSILITGPAIRSGVVMNREIVVSKGEQKHVFKTSDVAIFKSETHLATFIQNCLLQTPFLAGSNYIFKMWDNSRAVDIVLPPGVSLTVPNPIAIFMGVMLDMSNLDMMGNFSFVSGQKPEGVMERQMNVSRLIPEHIQVCCSAIDPIVVGSTLSKVLKMFPYKRPENNYFQYEPHHLDFMNIAVQQLSDLHFQLVDLSGSCLGFGGESEIVINLVFRNEDVLKRDEMSRFV